MPSASTSHPMLSDSPKHSIFLSEAGNTAPPIPLLDDDPEGADAARQRLAPKSRWSRLFERGKKRGKTRLNGDQQVEEVEVVGVMRPSSLYDAPITLDASSLVDQRVDMYRDQYEWAVVYENQRGMTIFSTPYYSSLSLLPTDPSPFTLPSSPLSTSVSSSSSATSAHSLSSIRSRSHQPPITLSTYPLPDGTWHWVSRCWMIDMRTNDSISSSGAGAGASPSSSGHDPDGFEYNWLFRSSHWRPAPGPGGAGGWVRRRRWVRLMVREARENKECVGESRTLGTPTPKSGTPVMTPRVVETPTMNSKRSSAWYAVGGAAGAIGEAPIIQSPRHRHSIGSSILSEASGITGSSSSSSSHAAHPSAPSPSAIPAPTSPSTPTTPSSSTHSLLHITDPDEIFLGSVDADWERLRGLMRRFGRDGRKLECWSGWLGVQHIGGVGRMEKKESRMRLHPDDALVGDIQNVTDTPDTADWKGKRRQKQWTEDEEPMPSEVKAARAKARAAASASGLSFGGSGLKSTEKLRLGGIEETKESGSLVDLAGERSKESVDKSVIEENENEVQNPDANGQEKDKAGVSKVKKEHLVAVLKKYTHEILHLFIYPDSRAQFIQLLGRSGVLNDLGFSFGGISGGVGPGVTVGSSQEKEEELKTLGFEVDFWSYVRALGGDEDGDDHGVLQHGDTEKDKRRRKPTKEEIRKAILEQTERQHVYRRLGKNT
ncbi:hypothetical protein CPB83DRAFT_896134 [Crepidotus variabilis]|uniref:TECPR1-like DysF domain-containing protein n=1 Tax=Crepidotus variabilis TaxID=179855 RepID=A0A9P6ECD7_9AGAR|nr:hypothetical protein CPB83DRAFT_896134 [Crepidotus variabilis]